jgi:hypothetical protein
MFMKPIQIILKKYLDIFAGQEMYFINDIRNLALFEQKPLNTSAEDIQTKLSAINDEDIRSNLLMNDMVIHIIELGIDDRLKRGDLSLVEDLATINSQGKSFHLLHFASLYCNLHRPEIYPIYSEQHLGLYKKYIVENNLPFDPERLDTYEVFSKVLNDLLQRLGLSGKMNYLHIRKFGWLYIESVLKESENLE